MAQACIHLWVLAIAVLFAAASFHATQGRLGLTAQMIAFLTLVCISRCGLYNL